MPAYRIVEWEQPPRLVEAPVPEPGPGEVLVAVAANGLCHSDLEMAKIPAEIGDLLGWRVPFTLGHEIAGHVAGLGAGVTGLAEGDAVALVSPASCGECPACRRGHDSVCPQRPRRPGLRARRRPGAATSWPRPRGRSSRSVGSTPSSPARSPTPGATSHHAVARVVPRLGDGLDRRRRSASAGWGRSPSSSCGP